MILLILSLLTNSKSTKYLPNGLIFQWEFQENYLNLSFWIPDEVKNTYQWVGLGLKSPEDGESMKNCDILTIIVDSNKIEDRWSFSNDYPNLDTDLSGYSNLEEFSLIKDEEYTIYNWSRLLETEDKFDTPYLEGEDYYILWAMGNLDTDGTLLPHKNDARGTESLTLEENYYDNSLANGLSFLVQI